MGPRFRLNLDPLLFPVLGPSRPPRFLGRLPFLAIGLVACANIAPHQPSFDAFPAEGEADGWITCHGQGSGSTRSESMEKAEADARAKVARQASTGIRDSIELLEREEGGLDPGSWQAWRSYRRHLTARAEARLRGGEVAGDPMYTQISANEVECRLALRFSIDEVYPHLRLTRLEQSEPSPAARAKAALALADRYLVEGRQDLSRIAARLATVWDEKSAPAWDRLAVACLEAKDYAGELGALFRLEQVVSETERPAVKERQRRARNNLLTTRDLKNRLVEEFHKAARAGEVELTVLLGGESPTFSFDLRRPGHLFCLWLDEGGVGRWRPTRLGAEAQPWPRGQRLVRPAGAPTPGPARILVLLSPEPLEEPRGLPIPPDREDEPELVRLERLGRLEALLEWAREVLQRQGVAAAVTECVF